MPKFGSQIDTQRIPVKGLTPESATAFPTDPPEGLLYHRSDQNAFYIFLNGSWVRCDNNGVAASAHIHAIADVTGLQAALDAKAPTADPTFTGTVSGVTKTHVGLANVDNTSDANKPVSSAQQTALNLKANLASPTFTGTVGGITKSMVGLANVDNTSDAAKPVSTAQQAALNLKADITYVDNAIQGLDTKASVKYASSGTWGATATPTLTSANMGAIDGTPAISDLPVGTRVLRMHETSAQWNGIYVVTANDLSNVTFGRATDMNTWDEVPGAFVFVEQSGPGTGTYANTGWTSTADQGGTLNTTAITWTQFSSAGNYTAGDGLSLSGLAFFVNVDDSTIEITQDTASDLRVKDAGITAAKMAANAVALSGTTVTGTLPVAKGGTGGTTAAAARTGLAAAGKYVVTFASALVAGVYSANITHNLNSSDVQVSFREISTGEPVGIDWKTTGVNTVQIRADVAYSANTLSVTVVG